MYSLNITFLGIPNYDEAFMKENCIGPDNTLDNIIMEYMLKEDVLTNE